MDHQSRYTNRQMIILSVGLIIVFALLVYLSALGNGFVFDDHPMIEERTIIQQPSLSSVKEVLFYNYRPIRDLALMFIASIVGPHPVGFHLSNVFLHLMNAVMVYVIVYHLTRSIRITALSALLFAIHPIQTDAVTYVSGIRDTLSTLFVLIGLYTYMIYREQGGLIRFILIISMLLLGLGTKEMAVGLLLLIFLYDLQCECAIGTGEPLKAVARSMGVIFRRGTFFYLSTGLILLLALVFYLIFHHASARIQENEIHWWGGSILLNYLTVSKLWLTYLKKLVFPYPLTADYMEFPLVPTHPGEISAWLSLLMLIVIFYVTLRWLSQRPLWGFALGWALLTLTPVVQIFPHHELMAEHHLYLPSVGFCLLVALGLDRLMDQTRIKWVAGATVMSIIVIYSLQTVSRNLEWQNDLTLFLANLRDFQRAPRSYMQLGNFYQKANLFISAREAYEKALSIDPNFPMARNNLGVLYYRAGQPERAIDEYQKALNGPFAYTPAFTNLGMAYLVQGRTQEGIQALEKGLSLRPRDRKIIAGLYYAYRDSGQESAAEGYLQQWLTIYPADPNALQELAKYFERNLDFNGALNVYDELLKASSQSSQVNERRSMLVEMQAEMEKLQERMKSDLENSESYLQVARYYQMLGVDRKAREVLEDALVHFPQDVQVVKAYLEFQIRQMSYNRNNRNRVSMIGKDPLKDPGIRLLVAQTLALDQKIDEAYRLVQETLRSRYVGHKLQNVVLPKAKAVSKCDQTRTLAKVFDLSDFPETALGVLEMPGCEGSLLEKVHLERARLFVKLKKIVASIHECEQVLKMNPDSAQAHAALGFIMLRHVGDYEAAAYHLKESLRLEPEQQESKQLHAVLALLERYIYTIRVEQTAVDPSSVSIQIAQLIGEYDGSMD